MPTRFLSFLLALVVFPLPGFAQVFDMEKDRVPMTVLDGAKVAHAARAFGQEDDITVLTVAFAPVEVAIA